LRFARLVADDRVELATCHGRLLLRAPQALAGLIELRGVGIRRVPWEGVAVAGWVIDLAAPDAERMPDQSAQSVEIEGVQLPRLAIGAGAQAAAVVLAALHSDAR
jgi:serine kinase of HPr protein (carbohydrate metabolism regulator)